VERRNFVQHIGALGAAAALPADALAKPSDPAATFALKVTTRAQQMVKAFIAPNVSA
jgi:hypothetical protein